MPRKSFSWSPIRKLMKKQGASLATRDAVERLIKFLDDDAKSITQKAIDIAKQSSRNKVTIEDIRTAIDLR